MESKASIAGEKEKIDFKIVVCSIPLGGDKSLYF
jgi:hypothetical protein